MSALPKVGIIGCGFVGATTAYTLLVEGIASELVLIGREKKEVEGQGMDLMQGMEFLQSAKVISGSDYKLCKDCDIIVITAGAHQEKGETRLDLVKKNAVIFKEMIPKITQYNKKAILIVVTNPVDVMTYLTLQYSHYPKERVIGTGTSLDTARFRYFISEQLKVSPNSVHAYILGEHGDSSFPVWSSATIGGVNLKHFPNLDLKARARIYEKTKNAAYEVIARKGATYYAIALTIADLIKAIAKDSNRVLPLSCYQKEWDVCLSVPVIVNKKGIDRMLPLDLDKQEMAALKKSAVILKEARKTVK